MILVGCRLTPVAWSAWCARTRQRFQRVCGNGPLVATRTVDFGIRNSISLEQAAQASVLFNNALCSCLDLSGSRNAHLLAVTISRLQFLEVVLAPGARTPLVVADARQIGTFLGGECQRL